jgi:ubiquinone/menaquinone biosynthesis C-methylase UbiE
MIQRSIAFYDHLQKKEQIKKIFYHFKSLLTITQYERLFNDLQTYADKKQQAVLDWGCGNGWFSYYLIYSGFGNVTSYGYGWDDISPAMEIIPELNVVNGAECKLQTPSQLPFEDASYNFVFSIGVLEHVHETGGDQHASMKEIHRVLKPAGTFYCYHFPNKYTWIEFLKRILVPKNKRGYLHTKKFTEQNIKDLAAQSGFIVQKIKRYNFLPYNIFRINRLDNKFVGFVYKSLDNLLCLTPLNIFCQCYMFIATKK